MFNEIEKFTGRENILLDEPLKKHSTFKIGGICKCIVFPQNINELISILKFIKENSIKYYVIGNGSNILFSDNGFSGIIIKTTKLTNITVNENSIISESGVMLSKLCDTALKAELDGIAALSGIPGTVGGAVYMNAGAYGTEIKDVLLCSYYLDENFKIKKIFNKEHVFAYRYSFFTNTKNIILKSEFLFSQGNIKDMKTRTAELLKKRSQKQPLNYPSAGSTFKRPDGLFAGQLIEQCGLKGYSVGGAKVSEKHSGFVINAGNATERDIKALIEHIQNEVYKKYNIQLEREVLFL